MTLELPVITIPRPSVWENWLKEHHQATNGVWIKIAKKDSGLPTATHDQLLDIALCYGWIDGQRKGLDETYFLQKFTPRRPRSLWSKRNIQKVEALIAAGKMQPTGFAEIEAAKQDGRWAAAYDSQKDMKIPDDFLAAVSKNSDTQAFFDSLSKTSKFAIGFRLATARKSETRQRRFNALLAMLERKEKP